MSLRSIETKHLITKGFKDRKFTKSIRIWNVHKKLLSLGSHITPMGAAFYIVPLVNAIVRSGTLEENGINF